MRKVFISEIVVLFTIFAVFLTACTNQTAENSNKALVATNTNTESSVTTNVERAFKIDLKSENETIQSGTPATLSFTVRDKQGAVVKDLQIVHEKPMHLLVVSKDLAEFYHIHPEQSADGSYRASHNFPNGGEYRLYADFTPKDAAQVVEQIDIRVAGTERAKVALQPDTRLEKTIENLKVVMKPSSEIKAGQELMLDFQAFDAASGQPAADLQNYLGELAHFVIISEDLKDFVHAHPMAKGGKMNEMKTGGKKTDDHSAGKHDHSTTEAAAKTAIQSEVSAHTAFPRAGLYKLWAQFQRRGKVISVPFIVNVPPGNTEPARAANVPEGATKITVTASGFEPALVTVKKGQPVKLAFYRPTADGCGTEVVFSKLNITKKLPVGEIIPVEFTANEAGEISFACGMNMMRRKVFVSEN